MIARTWHATASTVENADTYCHHFRTEVVPRLRAIASDWIIASPAEGWIGSHLPGHPTRR